MLNFYLIHTKDNQTQIYISKDLCSRIRLNQEEIKKLNVKKYLPLPIERKTHAYAALKTNVFQIINKEYLSQLNYVYNILDDSVEFEIDYKYKTGDKIYIRAQKVNSCEEFDGPYIEYVEIIFNGKKIREQYNNPFIDPIIWDQAIGAFEDLIYDLGEVDDLIVLSDDEEKESLEALNKILKLLEGEKND